MMPFSRSVLLWAPLLAMLAATSVGRVLMGRQRTPRSHAAARAEQHAASPRAGVSPEDGPLPDAYVRAQGLDVSDIGWEIDCPRVVAAHGGAAHSTPLRQNDAVRFCQYPR